MGKKYEVGGGKAAAQLILPRPAKSELLPLLWLPTLLLLGQTLRLLGQTRVGRLPAASRGRGPGVSGGPGPKGAQGPVQVDIGARVQNQVFSIVFYSKNTHVRSRVSISKKYATKCSKSRKIRRDQLFTYASKLTFDRCSRLPT